MAKKEQQKFNFNMKIAVIGGGSWATALVKIVTDNNGSVGWWIRNEENIEHLKTHRHNANYLRSVEFPMERIHLSSNINDIVDEADCLIFAIPSAFLKNALNNLSIDISNKLIFSAIKGIVPDENLIVGEFFHEKYGIALENIGVISGPCHAEEVALERLSYLTLACLKTEKAEALAKEMNGDYIKTTISDDIYGTEYSAVLKNIYAIAAGICHGLGYGDNFQAVLVSNAIREMKKFIKAVHPIKRDINNSAYLGDLLVTAYSQFSRNRTLGNMIGKGYTVNSAILEMNMVAEGYYAANLIREVRKIHDVRMPIANAVYKILYEGKSPKRIMLKLADKLN